MIKFIKHPYVYAVKVKGNKNIKIYRKFYGDFDSGTTLGAFFAFIVSVSIMIAAPTISYHMFINNTYIAGWSGAAIGIILGLTVFFNFVKHVSYNHNRSFDAYYYADKFSGFDEEFKAMIAEMISDVKTNKYGVRVLRYDDAMKVGEKLDAIFSPNKTIDRNFESFIDESLYKKTKVE